MSPEETFHHELDEADVTAGNERMISTEYVKIVHVNTGSRPHLMPRARRLMIVT